LRERVRVRVADSIFILDDRDAAGALTLPSPGGRGFLEGASPGGRGFRSGCEFDA
jgi:hypothetical protein